MTALRHTATLAGFELRGVTRSRWIPIGGVVFALAAVAAAIAGLRSFSSLGLAGAGAATDGLVHVALLLPPLVGLLLGAGSLARDRERGLLAMFASQPIARGLLPVTSFVGCVLAVWAVVAVGLGAGILVISMVASAADVAALGVVFAIALGAAATSVALGVMLSAVSNTHHRATAAAATLWLMLALGIDLLLAGVAPGLRLGPAGLLAAVLINPLEAARVLALLLLDGASALGPFGAYLTATFGRSGTIWVLTGTLVGWTLVPLGIASLATARRDV
jgi:Cu-processing system permease protein